MIQENGMSLKFQVWDSIHEKMLQGFFYLGSMGKLYQAVDHGKGILLISTEGCIPLHAIGATSSDDPPQELYLGDLIEFERGDHDGIEKYWGLIVWYRWKVCVRFRHGKYIRCWDFGVVEQFSESYIKKLGSRYTHPEIWKKAGLEKP